MDVGFVSEVHQVVDHQAVIALNVKQPSAIRPLITHSPFQMRNQGGIGLVPLPRPDPDESVTLDGGKGLVAGKAPDTLTGHGDRLAIATHHQTVVTADQLPVLDESQRERGTAMRTEVLEGHDLLILIAVEHHLLIADLPAERLVSDFIRCTGHVPRIFRMHEDSPRFGFVVMDPSGSARGVA